uniref:Uncharacterized protein n=2 Tax=Phaeomonas parva TaxID=124430 RepID=A0A7S1UKH3_9STRA|mmetsp:Transcript_9747/g.28627  ORF Transcript_9747/g.28627 Transcript_9747/m.28627 type:complete len:106 (+) Transcript_9747:298-615(+)
MDDLARDISTLRKKEGLKQEDEGGIGEFAKGAFVKILLADFFVVLAFLGWFIVGLLQKYGGGAESPILDSFRANFETLVQPALGLLMGGTLLGGALEKINGNDDN